MSEEVREDLGNCCACLGTQNVNNIMCMPFEGPPGFQGWGCMICGIPTRGAIAVLCDTCVELGAVPRYIVGGRFVSSTMRVTLDGFERKAFDHIEARHAEYDRIELIEDALSDLDAEDFPFH